MRREARRKQHKKALILSEIKKLIIWITAILLVTALLVGINTGINNYHSSRKYLAKQTAYETEHFKITNAQLAYFYYEGYYGFLDLYKDKLSEYGLDPDKKLSEQPFNMNDSYATWHDYFLDSAKNQIEQLLPTAEYAVSHGYELSEGMKNAVKIRAERLELSKFPGVDVQDAQLCFELMATALDYQYEKQQSFALSDAEALALYEENSIYYSYVDLRSISIAYAEQPSDGELSREQAQKYADEFKSCTNSEEFTDKIYAYLDAAGKFLDGEPNAQSNRATVIANSYTNKYAYTEGGDLVTEWLFDSSRKTGDVKVYDNEGSNEISAYMIVSPAYPLKDDTCTVRHILFRTDTYGSKENAKAEAERVLAQFQTTDKTEASFFPLALAYSEDANTCYIGGKYYEFAASDMSSGENTPMSGFVNWCFDEKRVAGDCEIVESDYGYHIILYVSPGSQKYIAEVRLDMMSEEYSSISEAIEKITLTDTGKADSFRSKL